MIPHLHGTYMLPLIGVITASHTVAASRLIRTLGLTSNTYFTGVSCSDASAPVTQVAPNAGAADEPEKLTSTW